MAQYQAYLFDFDGTIADTSRGIKNAIRYAAAQRNFPEKTDGELDYFIGPPLYDAFAHVYGTEDPLTSEMVDLYRVYYSDRGVFESDLYPGILSMLTRLKGDGAILAITSSKPQHYLDILMDHLHVGPLFDAVIGPPMNNRLSDKSILIARACETLGLPQDKSICIVGDRHYDVAGGVKAGITAIGAAWGFGTTDELMHAGADFVINAPEELL